MAKRSLKHNSVNNVNRTVRSIKNNIRASLIDAKKKTKTKKEQKKNEKTQKIQKVQKIKKTNKKVKNSRKNQKNNKPISKSIKENKTKPKTKTPKAPKAPKQKGALPNDVLKKIKDAQTDLGGKSIANLKELLKKNIQVQSGTKKDLIERVAQCKVLGTLPNCPKCFGGRLKFNLTTGEYSCPGFMEGSEFHNCNFKATEGITRNTWVD